MPTFGGTLPVVAGQASEAIGVWAFVAGAASSSWGMVFEGI